MYSRGIAKVPRMGVSKEIMGVRDGPWWGQGVRAAITWRSRGGGGPGNGKLSWLRAWPQHFCVYLAWLFIQDHYDGVMNITRRMYFLNCRTPYSTPMSALVDDVSVEALELMRVSTPHSLLNHLPTLAHTRRQPPAIPLVARSSPRARWLLATPCNIEIRSSPMCLIALCLILVE